MSHRASVSAFDERAQIESTLTKKPSAADLGIGTLPQREPRSRIL
jgi:hypothetical protein